MALTAQLLSWGNELALRGQFREAASYYQQLVQLEPGHGEALHNLGLMLAKQQQFAEALAWYDRALASNAQYADAHYHKGNALRSLRRLSEAVEAYRAALRLRPDFAEARGGLGNALAGLGRAADALAEHQEAVRLKPDSPEGHSNVGLALAHLGRHDEALASYNRALELRPDFVDAHYNRSLTLLTLGNFSQGWSEFEWRWRYPWSAPRNFSQPLWDGRPLAGQTILLHSEQGLGDTIQFIRYAPLVKARGGQVVVECQPALVPLLTGCHGIDLLIGRCAALPAFTVHSPLVSLGRVFETGLATIPAEIPYLQAEPARVEHWRREVGAPGGFKIGIAWQGSSAYRWDFHRSVRLAAFAPLAQVPGVRLISLQKGHGVEQIGNVNFEVADLGSRFDPASFADVAAAVMDLDLIVTVDTAIGHLAGALGRPVWVALSFAPDWRWLLARPDSPWYPTMRLFRQERFGDWEGVFNRIAAELSSRG
jgi:Flp pilus assembly protein TadD